MARRREAPAEAVAEEGDEECRTPRVAQQRAAPPARPPPPPRKRKTEPCARPPKDFFRSPDIEAFFAAADGGRAFS